MHPSYKFQQRQAPRILVTGFGPFPGVPFNASAALVRHMAATSQALTSGTILHTACLPTEWRRAAVMVRELVETHSPRVVLHFGVSARARGFVLETRAVNVTDGRPDCAGKLPPGHCVRTGGRAVLESTLPVRRLLRQLRLARLPVMLSRDAGRYLCNAVLYESLTLCGASRSPPLAGFIHIPALTETELDGLHGRPCGWAELQKGAAVILRIAEGLAIEQRRRALCSRPILR